MKPQFPDYTILYVDDEEKSLKYFEAIFDHVAPVLTANGPAEGYRLFEEHHESIGLVLSDQKMPGESGLEFLERVQQFDPVPYRILVTAYADLGTAVEALNNGLLYSYLSKPWDPDGLEHRLARALKHFTIERERDRLIEEKSEVFQQLMMADRAASIGILSSGLNHHLRNALMVLQTFHEMLPMQLHEEIGREPADASFWKESYEEAGAQIGRMAGMLSSLAEGAGTVDLEIVGGIDLAETMRCAGAMVLAEDSGIEVVLEIEEGVPRIEGDERELSRMARLLFKEARSSLPRGGVVEVRVAAPREGGGVRIEFTDNGDPIPEQDLERLFDPFFVRWEKPGEIGTNLTACYLTVYRHGGTIRAERSEDGRNSVVILLPVEHRPETVSMEALKQGDFPARNPGVARAALPA